ncbi:MAG: adenylate/guanylate cyclase domain-containing protein [Bacteroidota bacterium]
MPLSITPKFKRNVTRIVPFGLIWLLTGWLFSLSEALLPNSEYIDTTTDINLTFPVFTFAAMATTSLGLLVGVMETLTLQKRFHGYSFLRKITLKFLIYLILMLSAICITYPTAVVIESGASFTELWVWQKTGRFLLSSLFFNVLLQLSFSLFLCLLYSAVSENLGHSVLLNFFTGKYTLPVVENRIFMFLDMKGSTTIAERLGHVRYFELLGEYYNLMSDPIINHLGEVYQYIGDEVVVTWKAPNGLENNHCIKCFFEIKQNLQLKHDYFLNKFGVIPDFKAGMHIGEATTGEIGALKKEIVFVGDVLNTAARIQGMCNEYNTDFIISYDIRSRLDTRDQIDAEPLGDINLKGKSGSVKLFAVTAGDH